MAKARSCPNCKKHLRNLDYKIDDELNVVCNHCGSFVFKSKESKIQNNPDTVYKFNPNKASRI